MILASGKKRNESTDSIIIIIRLYQTTLYSQTKFALHSMVNEHRTSNIHSTML